MPSRTTLHAWLMLGPAMVLLIAFTHYPAVSTLWHSLFSTPRGSRPARFVGLENYQALVEDPVFGQAFRCVHRVSPWSGPQFDRTGGIARRA